MTYDAMYFFHKHPTIRRTVKTL